MEDKKLLEWWAKWKEENPTYYLSDSESDMLGKSYRPLKGEKLNIGYLDCTQGKKRNWVKDLGL